MMLSTLFFAAGLISTGAYVPYPDPCSPCFDGSAWNETMMLPDGSSCSSLSMLSSDLDPSSNECISLQKVAFEHCDCPAPPSFSQSEISCTICPDGSAVNEEIVIPMADVTCGFAQDVASDKNETECSGFQVYAAWCECSGLEPTCTLCADGSSPPNTSYEIPGLGVTCGDVEFIATTLTDEMQCNEISALASVCECPPIAPPACTLCEDGEPSVFPNYILPNGVTCSEVEDLASTVTSDHDCDVLKTYAASSCGCADVVLQRPPCTSVCPDGSPVPVSDRVIEVINGRDITCGRLDEEVDLGLANEERCQAYFYIGVAICGCQQVLLDPPTCNLCEDGNPPPSLFKAIDGTTTCADFAGSAISLDDPTRCTALQATAGVACGCNNPKSSALACRLCGDGQFLPDIGRIADSDDDVSCGEVEYIGNMAPEARVCNGLRATFADTCCGATMQVPDPTQSVSQPNSATNVHSPSTVLLFTTTALVGEIFLVF